jgi:hypothetical protein
VPAHGNGKDAAHAAPGHDARALIELVGVLGVLDLEGQYEVHLALLPAVQRPGMQDFS